MKKILIILVVASLAIIHYSCASITYGKKGNVTLYSNPSNITVEKLTITKGKKNLTQHNVSFPYKVPKTFVKTTTPAIVNAYYRENESPISVVIDKKITGSTWVNILWWPGFIVDAATGCIGAPTQKTFTMNFADKINNTPPKQQIAQQQQPTQQPSAQQQSGERSYSIEELQALGVIGGGNNTQQPAQQVASTQNSQPQQTAPQRILSDVDKNIPETGAKAENTFVLIIANEDYQFVDKVDFALNDGNTFKEYCIKTLGVPEKQVWLYENASYGIINSGVSKMVQAMNMFDNPNAIIYYCGHGIPDEKTGDAYIIPTDGNGKNMATCYSLNSLYNTFSETKAANVTYFMDACFTGASKDGSMLVAARGVAREPKKETLAGNAVVFSATSSDETAMAYKEKQHGLFTYFLLKKLQETKGDVSYEELSNYINTNVKKEAFLTNEKPQTPVVATSPAMQESWKSKKLK